MYLCVYFSLVYKLFLIDISILAFNQHLFAIDFK